MPLRLLMDAHVPAAVSSALAARGVDVLTAQQDGSDAVPDSQLLKRATELGRVLFSQDKDLLSEATYCQRNGIHFGGVIYAHQLRITIGQCIDELELMAKVCDPPEIADDLKYLPL